MTAAPVKLTPVLKAPPSLVPGSNASNTVNGFTKNILDYIDVNSKYISWYQEYSVEGTGIHTYHIQAVDGTNACVTEGNHGSKLVLDFTDKTLNYDDICKWNGYILGTFYPTGN